MPHSSRSGPASFRVSSGKIGSLYGLDKTNSNRYEETLWGKNQFNSTFPVSFCLYMRDQGDNPVCLWLDSRGNVHINDNKWKMNEIVGSRENRIEFHFEESFEPYSSMSRNSKENIDLVVLKDGSPWRPLEIKLTVLPDTTTVKENEELWGPELVIRPVSSAYAMMGIMRNLNRVENVAIKNQVLEVIKPVHDSISSWDNQQEVLNYRTQLIDGFQKALNICHSIQNPFLIQPIWRTKGQTLSLCEKCFDIFVWSDAALLQIPIDQSRKDKRSDVTRLFREIVRHVKAMHDIITGGTFDYNGIYRGMGLGNQTDKAFSITGKITRKYMNHKRLIIPLYSKEMLHDLILDSGQVNLKPERRFDASVVAYFLHET